MAKSKEQKQLEAIQRKRSMINSYRETWMKYAYGTESRQKLLQNNTEAKLDELFERADKAFKEACKEAQVDTHGNPLPGSPGYKEPGLLLDPKAAVKMRVKGLYTEMITGKRRHEPVTIISSGSPKIGDLVDSEFAISFDHVESKELTVHREKERKSEGGLRLNLDFNGDDPLFWADK